MLVNTRESGSWEALPRPVQAAFAKASKASNIIPRLAVFDADAEKELGVMTYEQIKEGSSGFRPVKKAIDDYIDNYEAAASTASTASAAGGWDGTFKDTEMADWTSAKGTKIRAKAVKFADDKLTLLDEKGRKLEVTLKQLDAASGKKVEEMVAAAKKSATTEPADKDRFSDL